MGTRTHRRPMAVSRCAVLVGLIVVAASCGSGEARRSPSTSEPPRTTTTRRPPRPSTSVGSPTTPAPSTLPPGTTAPPSAPPSAGRPPGGAAVEVWRGPTTRRAVALTFDAGSDAGHAGEVLDILTAEHVTASFGVTGTWAEANPGLVRRMGQVGQILNHTYDHRSFTGYSTGTAPLGSAERRSELDRAEAAIRSTGAPAAKPWFRPPYGDRDAGVLADVGAAGYRYVAMWSLDSLGWKGLSADQIVARCLDGNAAQPGAIYLFHVGSQSADYAALRRVIEGLRARGFTFDTVAGLVAG